VAGTYQPLTGQASCLKAPAGSFVSTTGATAATPCPAGTYQPNSGQSGCVPAPLGFYVDTAGATAATACPAGTTTLTTGSTSCVVAESPTTAEQCTNGGWQNYVDASGRPFKSEAGCLRYVAKLPPA
jgi:hypothetical protein